MLDAEDTWSGRGGYGVPRAQNDVATGLRAPPGGGGGRLRPNARAWQTDMAERDDDDFPPLAPTSALHRPRTQDIDLGCWMRHDILTSGVFETGVPKLWALRSLYIGFPVNSLRAFGRSFKSEMERPLETTR